MWDLGIIIMVTVKDSVYYFGLNITHSWYGAVVTVILGLGFQL